MVWPYKQNLRKDSPSKLYLPKQMGKDQLDDLELDVMDEREVWRLYLELLPRNPNRRAGNKERRRRGLKNYLLIKDEDDYW